MKIEDIGEFKLIERMKEYSKADPRVRLGIGDDCAALKFNSDSLLIATTDILIEGIHFHLEQISPTHLAYKSLAVNLSDIASMGATPLYALVSLGIPSYVSVEFIEDFYKGLNEYAHKYNVSIVGGDTSSSQSGLIINIVLLGGQPEDSVITRQGARIGDSIFVTGTLGDSSFGLKVFDLAKKGEIDSSLKNSSDYVIKRHCLPCPRISEGKFLAENRLASSMIDLSDGVASDVKRLSEQSRIGARIYSESIPLSSEMREMAESLGEDPLDFALYGGEDYELLFTVRKEDLKRLEKLKAKLKTPLSCIGEIVGLEEGIHLVLKDKILSLLEKTGYEHFKIK